MQMTFVDFIGAVRNLVLAGSLWNHYTITPAWVFDDAYYSKVTPEKAVDIMLEYLNS